MLDALAALRRLDTDQQVGLLFVALFGVLVLLSALILAATARRAGDDGPERRERRRNLRRDLRALWLGAQVA
ncbi:MAG: hypothetical protein ACK5RW_00710, partial [bacterium]